MLLQCKEAGEMRAHLIAATGSKTTHQNRLITSYTRIRVRKSGIIRKPFYNFRVRVCSTFSPTFQKTFTSTFWPWLDSCAEVRKGARFGTSLSGFFFFFPLHSFQKSICNFSCELQSAAECEMDAFKHAPVPLYSKDKFTPGTTRPM